MKITIDSKKFLPHQLQWWELPNFIKLLVGGFGSGKTFIGVLRAIYLSYIHRPTPGLLISKDYQMSKKTIIPTLNEIVNRSGLNMTLHKTDHEVTIHNWGGKFWIGSGDDPDSLRGPNLSWVGIDEPFLQKREVFDIALSRIRAGVEDKRELFLTGTPESLNWGYDICMDDGNNYDIGYVVGKSRDNPFIGTQIVKAMESAYTPEMREAYLEGKFVNLKMGRAYKPFDRDTHIKHQDMQGEICAGIDFNVDYMSAEIFILGNGWVHFIDEIRKSYSNTFELAEDLQRKYPGIRVFPDPTGGGRRSASTKTDHQILRDFGFTVFFRKQVPVMDRVNAVNSMLNQGRITIEPGKCDWLIKDFERVVFKSGDLDKTSEVELTHASDGAGYAIEYNFPYRKRTIEHVKV